MNEARIKFLDRTVISVGDDNLATDVGQVTCHFSQASLIGPREHFSVILNESILIMGDSVGWVKINEVARFGVLKTDFEIRERERRISKNTRASL